MNSFKEFKLDGCIGVPERMSEYEFINEFVGLMESKGWLYGGYTCGVPDDSDGLTVVCPFCGEIHERRAEYLNAICSCGGKYYAVDRTWLNRRTGEKREV